MAEIVAPVPRAAVSGSSQRLWHERQPVEGLSPHNCRRMSIASFTGKLDGMPGSSMVGSVVLLLCKDPWACAGHVVDAAIVDATSASGAVMF